MGVMMLLITEGEWRFTLSKNHVLELLNRATIKARDSVVVLRSSSPTLLLFEQGRCCRVGT